MGRVVLIGAGPGDPGLITCKGMELIQTCDVLIYDHLAGDWFFKLVKPECIFIDAGKQAGGHHTRQSDINKMMIDYAARYTLVVRLKGGDPFVFGRGYEELSALTEAGISCEVIPGISSAIAAPELAGIPLTHRGVSRSFHVITGHRMGDEALSEGELQSLAGEEGTLVFLMAVKNIRAICDGLIRNGKDPLTPAAVVENASLPQQRRINGTVFTIADIAKAYDVKSPAVLVIGETAGFSSEIKRRKTILTVGTASTVRRFAAEAARYHMQVQQILELEPVLTDAYQVLQTAVKEIDHYTWILLLSKQAVRVFEQALKESMTDIRSLASCRFAVNSSSTAEALESFGIHADFISEKPYSDDFAEAFLAAYSSQDQHILIPRAKQGSAALEKLLKEAGMQMDSIRAYDIRAKEDAVFPDQIQGDSVLAFLSASGVHAYVDAYKKKGMDLPDNLSYYCIGRRTKEALVSYGITGRIHVPEDGTLRGLAELIDENEGLYEERLS